MAEGHVQARIVSRVEKMSRPERLSGLKAFGLFIAGTHTLYQIAEALGPEFVARNPSTAAGRARSRIERGWTIICARKVERWRRYWSSEFPLGAWQTLSGARLDSHPKQEPPPPPTPFEQLLDAITAVEEQARTAGFADAALGLRNLGAALRFNHRKNSEDKKQKTV